MRKVKNLTARLGEVSGLLTDAPSGLRGSWRSLMPEAEALELELGCGKGSFICETAARNPNRLYVGLERIPDALVKGAETAARRGIGNVRFVIADASCLSDYFIDSEVSKLYIHFSDPWPHWRHAPRRLTSAGFLRLYAQALAPGGTLAFKTDNVPLFDFSLKELSNAGWEILRQSRDLPAGADNIETEYESRFRARGVPICCLEAARQITDNR